MAIILTKTREMTDGREVTIKQRYLDKEETRPQEGHTNVFVGKNQKYVGEIYRVGDDWQWGGQQFDRCSGFDEALNKFLAEKDSHGRLPKR